MKIKFWCTAVLLSLAFSSVAQESESTREITYSEIDLPCFFIKKLWVINDQDALDSLIQLASAPKNANCIELNPVPKINFEKYTLIGFGSAESGCNVPKIDLSFTQVGQTVYVRAVVTIQGRCRNYGVGKKWCLIPKVSQGVNFEMEVEKVYPK